MPTPHTPRTEKPLAWLSWRRANAAATVAWLSVIPVALLLGWLKSVVFVSAISLYANVASHLAAYRADVPNEPQDAA